MTTHYVKASGDDLADGLTHDTAWAGFKKLEDIAGSDKILYLNGDTWNLGMDLNDAIYARVSASGTSSNKTTIAAYYLDGMGNEVEGLLNDDFANLPTIDGQSPDRSNPPNGTLPFGGIIHGFDKEHVVVRHLRVQNGVSENVTFTGNGTQRPGDIVDTCHLFQAGRQGSKGAKGCEVLTVDTDIQRCGMAGREGFGSVNGNPRFESATMTGNTDSCVIRRCRIWDGHGILVGFEDNWDNTNGFTLEDSKLYNGVDICCYAEATPNVTIRRCMFACWFESNTPATSAAFRSEGGSDSSAKLDNFFFYNNLVICDHDTMPSGFPQPYTFRSIDTSIWPNSTNIRIFHNTFVNWPDVGISGANNDNGIDTDGCEFKNNLFVDYAGNGNRNFSDQGVDDWSNIIASHNLFHPLTDTPPDLDITNSVFSDPLLAKTSWTFPTVTEFFADGYADNFKLTSGSPAIGAGIKVAGVDTDFDGVTRSDPPAIGAFEFSAGSPGGGDESSAQINVGGNEYTTVEDDIFVAGEVYEVERGLLDNGAETLSSSITDPIAGTENDALVQTYRFLRGTSAQPAQYQFQLEQNTEYSFDVFYIENFWESSGKRNFTVSLLEDVVSPGEVDTNLDIVGVVGSRHKILKRTYTKTTSNIVSPLVTLQFNFGSSAVEDLKPVWSAFRFYKTSNPPAEPGGTSETVELSENWQANASGDIGSNETVDNNWTRVAGVSDSLRTENSNPDHLNPSNKDNDYLYTIDTDLSAGDCFVIADITSMAATADGADFNEYWVIRAVDVNNWIGLTYQGGTNQGDNRRFRLVKNVTGTKTTLITQSSGDATRGKITAVDETIKLLVDIGSGFVQEGSDQTVLDSEVSKTEKTVGMAGGSVTFKDMAKQDDTTQWGVITAANKKPVISLGSPKETGFIIGEGAITVFAETSVDLSDEDDTDLDSAEISISSHRTSEALDVDVTGTNIAKSYSTSTGILTLTGTDTLANYKAVIETLTYNDTDTTIFPQTRTLTFKVNDGTDDSQTDDFTINVRVRWWRVMGHGIGRGLSVGVC